MKRTASDSELERGPGLRLRHRAGGRPGCQELGVTARAARASLSELRVLWTGWRARPRARRARAPVADFGSGVRYPYPGLFRRRIPTCFDQIRPFHHRHAFKFGRSPTWPCYGTNPSRRLGSARVAFATVAACPHVLLSPCHVSARVALSF